MTDIFVRVLELSYSGTLTIVIILVFRRLLQNAEKRYSYYLWAIPWIKLVIPITSVGIWSVLDEQPAVNACLTVYQDTIGRNGRGAREYVENMEVPVLETLCIVWAVGVLVLLVQTISKYVDTRKRLQVSQKVRDCDNVYLSDDINGSFVFGILHPKIYLPYELNRQKYPHILRHEEVHFKRKDYVIKLLAYAVVILHWFNPIVRFGYYCLTDDMEMSCDEEVLRLIGEDARADYASTLLKFSMIEKKEDKSVISFGGDSTKKRIKNIMKVKRHSKLSNFLACCVIVLAVVFLLPQFGMGEAAGGGKGKNGAVEATGQGGAEAYTEPKARFSFDD
ncbi:MAG: M56 family metallopeptidase [Lachnospiraceae bacterium]|nr:M56 family metallopeptidase [Lachnospiraceae bacterium]